MIFTVFENPQLFKAGNRIYDVLERIWNMCYIFFNYISISHIKGGIIEVKKYPVSKFTIGIYIGGILFAVIVQSIEIWLLVDTGKADMTFYFVTAMCIVTTSAGLFNILFDLPSAKYSFTQEGITMYMGFRKYEYNWSEFCCAGILAINLETYGNLHPSDTFWVYFSKSFLTQQEKIRFLRKTRKDLNRVAFFQYNKPVFDLLMEKLPGNFREELKHDEEFIIGKMNFWERVYNK